MKRYVACWFYIIIYKAGKNISSLEYISKSTSRIERSRHFFSPFGLFKLNQQHEDAQQQKVILVPLRCPPVPPKYFRVGFLYVTCGFALRDYSQAHVFYSKRRLHVWMYVKGNSARESTTFWLRSIHTHTCVRRLSLKIEMLLPRTTKIFPRWNVWTSLANNFMCLFILKKPAILNFESPLLFSQIDSPIRSSQSYPSRAPNRIHLTHILTIYNQTTEQLVVQDAIYRTWTRCWIWA